MVDKVKGAARAFLGQGLGMGWGDEAEAWALSKATGEPYEAALRRIRQEYAEYGKASPITSGALEFAGGMAPAIGMAFVPGGQLPAAKSTVGALGRLAALGAGTGAVSGAGTAEQDRLGGAVAGGTLGTVIGLGTPIALRSAQGAGSWLRERLAPSEAIAKQRAEKLLYDAVVKRSSLTPQQIESLMAKDKAMGVPSTVANISPATARLTRGVAKTGGEGSEKIEERLAQQKAGARERTYQQVQKNLQPGDYYEDLAALQSRMRAKADPLYKSAYAYGEVTDPEVLKFLNRPQFKKGLEKAQELLEAEGRKLPTVKVLDPITGEEVEKLAPTVEMLDQVKRGIDTLIEGQTDAVTGKTTELGRVYTRSKNEFLEALDSAVPDYAKARAVYRGDAELADAMRKGLKDFESMDHEQLIKTVAGMSDAEKQAFRTGVARKLYKTIMVPSNEPNAAQRLIGSPEAQAKLQPLFDDPAHFRLFKTALEREAQLFKHASRILGGSDTAENIALKESLQGSSSLTDVLDRAIAGGGFSSGLAGMALSALSKGQMTDKTASRLADMLMSRDPAEVAAVVKALENYAAGQVPRVVRETAAERGAVMGTTTAGWPDPVLEQPAATEEPLEAETAPKVPSIELDLEADMEPARR